MWMNQKLGEVGARDCLDVADTIEVGVVEEDQATLVDTDVLDLD
jgi:hypothetical protein